MGGEELQEEQGSKLWGAEGGRRSYGRAGQLVESYWSAAASYWRAIGMRLAHGFVRKTTSLK